MAEEVREDIVQVCASKLVSEIKALKEQNVTDLEIGAAMGVVVARLVEDEESLEALVGFIRRHMAPGKRSH